MEGFYSVAVITFGFDPNNPSSNLGRTLLPYSLVVRIAVFHTVGPSSILGGGIII